MEEADIFIVEPVSEKLLLVTLISYITTRAIKKIILH